MGLLQNGKWVDQWYDTDSNDGKFVREDAGFRSWVTADGSAGPTGQVVLKPKPDATTSMSPSPALGRTAP